MGIHIILSDSKKNLSFLLSLFRTTRNHYSEKPISGFHLMCVLRRIQDQNQPSQKLPLAQNLDPENCQFLDFLFFWWFLRKIALRAKFRNRRFPKNCWFCKIFAQNTKLGKLASPKNHLRMEILVDLGRFALYQWNMLPTSIVDLSPWDSQLIAIKIPWRRHQVELGSVGLLE